MTSAISLATRTRFTPVEVTRYGAPIGVPNCVVLCAHGDDGQAFQQAYPEILEGCAGNEDLFARYMAIEYDFAATELSHAIADAISAAAEFMVDVVEARLPRAVIDAARVPEASVRNVFARGVSEASTDLLRSLHRNAIATAHKTVRSLHPAAGVFLDIHTMAPYSPAVVPASKSRAIQETPESLRAYVHAYVKGDGRHRNIDLITRTSDGERVADMHLVEALSHCLTLVGLRFDLNEPYTSDNDLIAAQLMRERRGITIDFPKDMFCYCDTTRFSFFEATIDESKLQHVARPVASAIVEVLTRTYSGA